MYSSARLNCASENGLYIIAGTHPVIQEGELFNAAHLFTPNGQVFRQKKVHLTPTEKGPYQMSRGHGFYVYHTAYGKIAILVCYDAEFPEAARVLAEAGAQILFVLPARVSARDSAGSVIARKPAQSRITSTSQWQARWATFPK
jgi:predicted amidohydrolase